MVVRVFMLVSWGGVGCCVVFFGDLVFLRNKDKIVLGYFFFGWLGIKCWLDWIVLVY